MGKNKEASATSVTSSGKTRLSIENGTAKVLECIQRNPSRSDTESIAAACDISKATVKRYAEMLVFAGKLNKHSSRTFYSVA